MTVVVVGAVVVEVWVLVEDGGMGVATGAG